MPDAFFQNNKTRKRKRSTTGDQGGPSTSKKPARAHGKPHNGGSGRGKKPGAAPSKQKARDEELSDETNDEEGSMDIDDMDLRAPDVDPNAYESAEEDEDETPAEKRLRLAKLYLEGVKEGLGLGARVCLCSGCYTYTVIADGEFDAAEIDKELISARLKQDVLEHAGKVHLFVADTVRLCICIYYRRI
jgi:ribosomal RNA-processing protein 9